MLAISRQRLFGQPEPPTEERALIIQMLSELEALPAEYDDKKIVAAMLVGEDVVEPQPDIEMPDLLLWPTDAHADYGVAWGILAATIGQPLPFPLEAMTVADARTATEELLTKLDAIFVTTPPALPPAPEPTEPEPVPAPPPTVVIAPSPKVARNNRHVGLLVGLAGGAVVIGITAAALSERKRAQDEALRGAGCPYRIRLGWGRDAKQSGCYRTYQEAQKAADRANKRLAPNSMAWQPVPG